MKTPEEIIEQHNNAWREYHMTGTLGETDEERDARFTPGNDKIWGEGNWIRCSICPHDDNDREVYHSKKAHD